MCRSLVSLLVVALVASNAAAFAPAARSVISAQATSQTVASTTPSSPFVASSSNTAMNMVRVKVDKNAKEEKLNPAVFKNAAYLGSIAIAVLLPVFFLLAASK